jgi:putative addiction module component (TIGR02574 family)
MADQVSELVERGKALSPQDRTRLVELLRESLDEPVDPEVEEAWRLEIRSRTAAYERGEATLYDADEVIAEAIRLTQ